MRQYVEARELILPRVKVEPWGPPEVFKKRIQPVRVDTEHERQRPAVDEKPQGRSSREQTISAPSRQILTVSESNNVDFEAGKLRHFVEEWKQLTSDPFIIEMVQGVRIPISHLPVNENNKPNQVPGYLVKEADKEICISPILNEHAGSAI